ncbi:uncharacterized protein LOC115770322 [Drosophila novamexicana]|uniref:uncharacterized protein LOC115770322 n=1 Tax=Drosophila novamexicana TaxID=47314 RepID=UPI0011E5A81D|nr:uncharacterized protein LOC115770322 [Drosophila novamexicana]
MSIVNNTINLDMITKKTFDRGYNVHVDFAIRLSRTKQYQRVFAHTMDTCGVVSTIKRNIFKAWFQSMWDRSNFVHSCPVTKGHYFLHNWKVDPQLVPQYLSAGDYRITCHFFYGKLKSKQEEFERHVEFLATNYTFNTKYFKNFTVSIANKTLNMDMELARPIQRGFKAHVDYQLRVANAKNFQTIFSHHFDVCAIVSNVKDGLLKSWFKSMLEYSNFMHNCPVEVGYYYLHNWKLGSTMTHQFLYPGEYRGQLYLFYGKYKTKTEDRVITLIIDSILYN